jgi:hypothetical protein
MAALKLNVIVLAVAFAPPLPVIIRVGLTASSTKLPQILLPMLLVILILLLLKIQPKLAT